MQAKLPYIPMQFKTRKNFEYGNCAHDRYQNAIKLIDPSAKSEVIIRFSIHGVSISGRADLVMNSPMSGQIVIEFKTMGGTEFKSLKEAKFEHICQLMIYLHHLNLKMGLIIYENKDEKNSAIIPELKIFEVTYDDVIFESIIADFIAIDKATKEGSIAHRFTPCPNKYCELKCDEKEKLNIFPLENPIASTDAVNEPF